MNTTTFLLLRLAIGASFFGHGLVRLPKLGTFSNWLVGTFSKSMLPRVLVVPFSYLLPVAEFAIGVLLLTGLFTGPALIGGCVVMIMLIFGCCLIENWEPIASQLIHIVILALLLNFIAANTCALDKIF